MGYIRLNPKDAEKHNVPAEIQFELSDLGRKQRRAFEAQTGRSLRWLLDQLSGVPVKDEHGNYIPEPVLDDDGKPVFEADGVTPKMEPKLTVPGEALDMFAYLILWGHGVRVPWDDFDLMEIGFLVSFADPDGDGEPAGKDDELETSSTTTT